MLRCASVLVFSYPLPILIHLLLHHHSGPSKNYVIVLWNEKEKEKHRIWSHKHRAMSMSSLASEWRAIITSKMHKDIHGIIHTTCGAVWTFTFTSSKIPFLILSFPVFLMPCFANRDDLFDGLFVGVLLWHFWGEIDIDQCYIMDLYELFIPLFTPLFLKPHGSTHLSYIIHSIKHPHKLTHLLSSCSLPN